MNQPTEKDWVNCWALLNFLTESFAGSTIGNLKIDDLRESLRVVLVFAQPKSSGQGSVKDRVL